MPALKFTRGDRVRDTYSERTGYITGKTLPFGESLRWQVGFGETEPEYVRESYLELISDKDDMFALFEQCRFNGILDLRRIIQQIRLDGALTNLFYSMHNSSTKFMPHQFKPVMKFIESSTGRLLIADEVGLGKTIEAIYIWKELLTRENAKRFLIVCPAQLCQKWKDDLLNHFGIKSDIVGAKDLLERLKEKRINLNNDNFVLITSIQGIRYKEQENEHSSNHSHRAKLNGFFDQFDIESNYELFDLVVIDEAHYLRNSSTASYNTGEKLRNISKYMVLLSATPIQTSSENLYNLLKLLSPEDFYNSYIFDAMLKENYSMIAFSNAIRSNRPKDEIIKYYNQINDKLRENKTLYEKIQSYIKNNNNSTEERMSLFYNIRDSNFYNQYFTRTRKRDVFENRIIRDPKTLKYSLSPDEYDKYLEITKLLKKLSIGSPVSKIFTLIARQRQMTSSIPATLKHWKDNDVMKEMLYEDMGLDEDDEIPDSFLNEISNIEISDEMIKRFTDNDSKYNKLLFEIRDIFKTNNCEKIIIFSYYRYTIKYLQERLGKNGINCAVIMGGMGDEKDEIIAYFKDSVDCNILISSEVGSEGIDLQFASIEINYDLPWNPMRLEQRIGRIDRIGQEAQKIRILHFICKDTIEDTVLERLYDRIDIFKYSIGDIEEILGDEMNQLSINLLTSTLSEKELLEMEFNRIDAIALRKLDMEKLEEQASLSSEFYDVILENINVADLNKRYIMSEELIQYTEDFFSSNYNGTKIERNDNESCQITLSAEARSDFRDFIKKNRYKVFHLGYHNDAVFCIFNNKRDSYKKWKIYYELIDINHPFIKWMKYLNQNKSIGTYSCSAIKINKKSLTGINRGLYAYYIQRWQSEGYKKTNELKYFVINTETKEIFDDLLSEKLIISSLNEGYSFSEIKYGLIDFENILHCMEKCHNHANQLFTSFENMFNKGNELICEQVQEYLKRTFERKKNFIEEKIKRARETGQSEKYIKMDEGKLKKAEETFSFQLNKIRKNKNGNCTPSDIAVGLIKVEE
jgi:superfamily II DNA or RNA helicase